MNNLKKYCLLFILSVSSVFATAQNFNITGKITGVEDGTWLYLKTASPQKMLDSSRVKDGRFVLVGKTDEKASQLMLHTRNFTNYLFFWAEKNTRLELKDGEFKKATITGSKTQAESELLAKMMKPLAERSDSLSSAWETTTDHLLKQELASKVKAIKLVQQQLETDYIRKNPNSIISANILNVYTSSWGKTKSAGLYQNLSSKMKSTSYGKNIRNFISLNQEIKIGGKYADFEQKNTVGKSIRLSNIKAKYILLEFWGSWCGPCREDNPTLVETYKSYKTKGFEILGVAADDNKAQWLKAVKDDGLPWENVCDLKGDKNEAALIYGITAYPTNFLIDQDGIIIAKDLRGDSLKKKLAELLP